MHDWLVTRDEVRLGVRRRRPSRGSSATAVVVVHGFGATKDDPSVMAVADELSRAGHHVVTYTGRGHGESGGLCTLGDQEHLDVEAAVGAARELGERVVLVGTSMGAIAVLRHAATAAVDGLVTVSGPAEWRVPRTVQSAGAALLTQLPIGRWLARRLLGVRLAPGWSGAAPPVELAAAVDAPHVVVHGRADRFIPWSEGVKLHRAAAHPARLVLVEGMGHAYAPESHTVIRTSVAWALSHAPAAGSAPVTAP
jgi:pimeloyl-ACP methyl ester carboxylesterase